MRRHRRLAGLTVAAYALAVTAAAGAILIPWLRDSPQSTAGDVVAGWALLAAACATVGRRPIAAVTLLVAGVVWVAVGVAPLFEGQLADVIARLALVPTALLVSAIALVAIRAQSVGRRLAALGPASAIAVVGAGGAYRFAMLALGACLLVPLVGPRATDQRVGPQRPALPRPTAAAAWVGVGLMAVGLSSAFDLTSPAFVTNLHQLIILTGAGMVALHIVEARSVAGGDPVSGTLTAALSDALGSDLVSIGFPPTTLGSNLQDGDLMWLDPTGRQVRLPDGGEFVLSEDGTRLAWLAPPLERGEHSLELLRLLDVAGAVARLRAELRARAIEIADSTERLKTAVDRERARLAAVLENGPIATLDSAALLLGEQRVDPLLLERLASAQRALRGAVSGMESIEDADQLVAAVRRLADRFAATCEIEVDGAIDPATCRLLWFTCAEGLANAAKHSPGAPVQVVLDVGEGSFELHVVDHGVGGADVRGEGLAGLRDRAAESGATLTVDSPPGGGTHLALVRVTDTCYPQSEYAAAPMIRSGHRQMIEP